ncbi:MAG TPA: hypothetical protein VGB24_15020 [Longimicrobium sp.]|jgi:hypothetical protein|uniref:hypothetical protein n=1 Tax=Longimicrobium sp. TaxID=2029185 RepID=UPI002EDA7018
MRIPAPLLAACMALAAAGGCVSLHPANPMTADPCPEIVEFSGFRWRVSTGRMQGDARWSRCHVEVRDGALVLRLSRAAGEPFLGAQLALGAADAEARLGFGRYEFRIDPVPSASLPPRGVFAMFSYGGPSGIDRRGVWGYNEIDVEINRSWLRTDDGHVIGTPPVYTVWPAAPSGRRRTGRRAPASHHVPGRTLPDPLASPTIHTFDWAPGSVRFASRHGDDAPPFSAWTAAGDDPAPGAIPFAPMVPMINLWAVASGARLETQDCGPEYPCGTWTVIVRSVRLPVPLHKHAGDGQQGAPGARLPDPLIVRVADEHERPLSGVAVEFSVTRGGGTLTPNADRVTMVTDADGLARAAWTLGPAGAQEAQARAVNGTREPVRFSARFR